MNNALLTDGRFNEHPTLIQETIEALQQLRVNGELGHAAIGLIGIASEGQGHDNLEELSGLAVLGYLRLTYQKEED